MIYILLFFSCVCSSLGAYSIVFIHLGPVLPDYLPVAIEQARLFNRECPIYLVGNQAAFDKAPSFVDESVQCVPSETLLRSVSHEQFCIRSTLDRSSFEGFWTYTSERFFCLEELIRQFALTDVFHLENDVMLYADLGQLLPVFQRSYGGKIGATFDNETRCIPGFVYISEITPIASLVQLMAEKAETAINDMYMLQEFKNRYGDRYIKNLPIIAPEYGQEFPLTNALGETTNDPDGYSLHFDAFQSIFDAAALGQYLGGISPRNGGGALGFINESCLFNPGLLSFIWKEDPQGRQVPFIQGKGGAYRVNNLHIHSKNLPLFFSKRIEE